VPREFLQHRFDRGHGRRLGLAGLASNCSKPDLTGAGFAAGCAVVCSAGGIGFKRSCLAAENDVAGFICLAGRCFCNCSSCVASLELFSIRKARSSARKCGLVYFELQRVGNFFADGLQLGKRRGGALGGFIETVYHLGRARCGRPATDGFYG